MESLSKTKPYFLANIVDISDFEKYGKDTIQTAVNACSTMGGGTVVVPKGKWKSGAIHLKSNINLHLEDGAVITFSDNPSDYLPTVFTRWEGVECYNYSPLIYANGCENIEIDDTTNQAIQINMFYEFATVEPASEVPPEFCGIEIKNIHGTGNKTGILIKGLPEKKLKNITLENINLTAENAFECSEVENITIKNITIRKQEER